MALMALRAVDLNLAGLTIGAPDGVVEDLAVLALLEQRVGHAHFAGDDDAVGGGQRLAGDADLAGSMPVFLASRNTRSTISSEMRSQTLSGWPSETDSEVKR